MILILVCVRIGTGCTAPKTASETEPVQAETTLVTEAPTEAATAPTVAPTQPGTVVEVRDLAFESGYDNDSYALEVHGCRMYTLDNGFTRFEVDYQTCDGLLPIAFAYIEDDHSHLPAFWYESETRTTQERNTLVFEMETEILNQSNGPDVHFQNRSYESVSYILIYI